MNMGFMLRRPTAFIPILMSVAALAVVGLSLAAHGAAPQPDEGTAAHIWQLLMAGQVPVVLFFAARWFPQASRQAALVLALQVVAAVAALLPVFLLGW